MATKEQIEKTVIDVLKNIFEQCGYEESHMSKDTYPLRDLPDLDSQLALEATVEISDRLGFKTDHNLFIDHKSNCILRIDEIAAQIDCLLSDKEESK